MTVAARLQPERQRFQSDERLVADCLKGNQQAWNALVDKYKNLIYSIPIRLGMYDDAADIFQAVCLDLLADLPRLRNPRALPKWLMQTCYHKCLQHRRRAEKDVPFDAQDAESTSAAASTESLPEELLVQFQREQIVRDVMTQLPPRCERMIRMLFFETPPRPYDKIANELGLATGSIGFIRGRCLARLKKQLEKMGF
jgi:RNA polymerase sigma factor (sigma-70 family)